MTCQRIRIVHLTDSHHTVGHPQLRRAVDVINDLEPPADLVVHGGDVINGYAPVEDMHRQAAEAREILDELRPPLLVTCCNHDSHGEPKRGEVFATHFHRNWVQEARLGDVHILAISGFVDSPDGLGLTAAEMDATPFCVGQPWSIRLLRQRLSAAGDARKLVFTHKPVFPLRGDLAPEDPGGKPVRVNFSIYSHPSDERKAIAEVFEECGVLAHYAGHVHFNARLEHGGVRYVATSATQSFPGEVRVIDVGPDSIEHRMAPVPGGHDLWVRWRNVTDPDHPTVREFYFGHPHERDFTVPAPPRG